MNNILKDIAKIGVGAVITEMGWLIWLLSGNLLPVKFIDLEFGFASIIIALFVNFSVALLLIYYAWLRKPKEKLKKEIKEE